MFALAIPTLSVVKESSEGKSNLTETFVSPSFVGNKFSGRWTTPISEEPAYGVSRKFGGSLIEIFVKLAHF